MNAIPIWWIKEWAENMHKDESFDDVPVDAYCDGYVQNVIECMLASWNNKKHSLPQEKLNK